MQPPAPPCSCEGSRKRAQPPGAAIAARYAPAYARTGPGHAEGACGRLLTHAVLGKQRALWKQLLRACRRGGTSSSQGAHPRAARGVHRGHGFSQVLQ